MRFLGALALITVLTTSLAGASSDQDDLQRALVQGLDATGPVRALATQSNEFTVPTVRAGSFSHSRTRAEQLDQALNRTMETGGSIEQDDRLIALMEGLSAEILLTEATLDHQLALIEQIPDAHSARRRVNALKEQTLARIAPLRQALEKARSELRAGNQPDWAALRDVLNILQPESTHRILGASTPLHRPRFSQRIPRSEPVVVPSYLDAAAQVLPADSEPSNDVPMAPAVLAKAAELGHDYARIYNFVRREIRTEWYAGQMRGPETTLRIGAGNDVDQAALLIGLLRASGAPARYVHGTIELDLQRLSSLLGEEGATRISRTLTRAGIANEPVVGGGQVTGFRLEHTWVSAHVPYANYRGSILDLSGTSWMALAPAIKGHEWPDSHGPGLLSLISDLSDFEQAYFSADSVDDELVLPAEELLHRAEVQDPTLNPHEASAQSHVSTQTLDILPASLPFEVTGVFAEAAVLADEFRQWVDFRFLDDSGQVVLDQSLPAADLAERRVTLAYQPAGSDDHDLILANGGIALTPPSLLQVRPVVNIDGLPRLVAAQPLAMASDLEIEIILSGPGGFAEFRQSLLAGGLSALHFGTGLSSQAEGLAYEVPVGESEQPAAAFLGGLASRYVEQWTRAEDQLGALAGARIHYPLPGLVMVNLDMASEEFLGLSIRLDLKGVALDAALRPVEISAPDPETERAWYRLSGLQGSILEHQVFEQQWATHAVSADRILALAELAGIPIVETSELEDLPDLPSAIRQAIELRLNQGYQVRLPSLPVTVNEWTGIGWIVRHPESGESGFFISGNYAGGSTTEPPEDWILDFLTDALRFPYSEPANEDPGSAARIRKIASSDNQLVTVGEVVDRPLSVLITDRFGRPVKGAQVRFISLNPEAEFPGSGSANIDAITDSLGVASVEFQASTEIVRARIMHLDPTDQYTTRVGRDLVAVQVLSSQGWIAASAPFRTIVIPGDPAVIERWWDVPPDPEFGNYYRMPHHGSLVYRVLDQFGNGVSNVAVELSALDEIDCPHAENGLPTRFAEAGSCSVGSGGGFGSIASCGDTGLSVATDARGFAIADLMLTNGTYARVVVSAQVGELDPDEYEILSPYGQTAPAQRCQNPDTGTIGYGRFIREARTIGGFPLEAAKPLEFLPLPRTLAIGCTFRGTAIIWHASPEAYNCQDVGENLAATVEVGNGGQASPLVLVEPMVYQFEAQAAPTPAWHGMVLQVDASVHGEMVAAILSGGIGSFFTVDGQVAIESELPAPINDDDRLINPVLANLDFYPNSYHPDYSLTWIQREGLVREWSEAYIPSNREVLFLGDIPEEPVSREYEMTSSFEAGTRLDPHEDYEVAASLNPGTPWEIQLEPTSLSHGQRIIEGFDAHSLSEGQVLPEVLDRFPRHMTLVNDIDVANQLSCPQGGLLRFALNHTATVSLEFSYLNEFGEPTLVAWTPIEDQVFEPGEHSLNVPMNELRFGDFHYELHATSEVYDGLEETFTGTLSQKPNRRDQLPLAHAMVKDVNLFDGSLSLAREDVTVDGRGPGLRFVRSYSPHRALKHGPLGFGWTHNYAAALRITACGEYIITGADGQSMEFVSDGFEDGVEIFRPLRGYNGTLRRLENNEFEFFSKDGTRYLMLSDPVHGHYLSLIEDPNGNSIEFDYTITDNERRLLSVSDDAGRSLTFEYETRTFEIEDWLQVTRPVITQIHGPMELAVTYEYDDQGNLIRATRQVGSSAGVVDEDYVYQDLDAQVTWPGDRPPGPYYFGYRLGTVRDRVNGSERDFTYEFGWDHLHNGDTLFSFPRQRIASVTEPDGGVTGFAYSGDRGLGPVSTQVTDARSFQTTYQLNQYGAATEVAGPIGAERIEWDLDVMRQAWQEDANGTRHEFSYDEYGNRTAETITHASGTLSRSWVYYPPEAFTHPIKNRLAVMEDYRGIGTTFDYDLAGNLTSRSRGGVSESFGYNTRGDRVRETDGTGYVRHIAYDAHGYMREASDSLGLIERQQWDALGRRKAQTDGEGFTTTFDHDSRGRVVRIDHPNGDFETIAFNDALNVRIETNARGIATTYTHDAMGRLLEASDGLGVIQSIQYDFHGNPVVEVDGNGNTTTHSYDGDNRRTVSNGPEGLVAERDYDLVGNLLTEKIGDGATSRESRHEYDHPRYERTLTRRVNTTGTDAVESFEYDGNGNRTAYLDPNNELTTWTYDDRDRMALELAPEGRTTTTTYDEADRRIGQTLNTSPEQVREWFYDGRGREVGYLDAEDELWIKNYDRRGLVIETIDPLASIVSFEHDERGRMERQSGPEPDIVTEFVYDPQGNVVSELQANGRLIESDYDIRDRLVLRSDQLGLVDAFDYDGNGNVAWEDDAEARRTSHTYNGLNHLIQTDLPVVDGQIRTLRWTRNVHGEAVEETNPRNLTTAHTFNALGQPVQTTLPDESVITRAFDPAGNLASETNARGFETVHDYDGLNRRIHQIDPTEIGTDQTWTYDVAGNVLTHTDRRGIESRTTYDGENRPLEERHAGALMVRHFYDEAGREIRTIDANGRETEHVYDRAGRRLQRIRPGNTTTTWTYNGLGDVLTETDPDGLTTVQTWDLRSRMSSRTNPADETTNYTYDGVGNRTRVERPSEDEWDYAYDDANRLISVTNPLAHETSYTWDANDNLTSQTNARAHTTSFTYDDLDHLLSRTYPNSTTETFEHDAHGNRTVHTDANGQIRTFSFDALDRLESASYPSATDSEASQVAYEYDGNGNRTEVTEQVAAGGTRTTTFRYDSFDRLDRETDRFGQTVTHHYDLKGNRIRRDDASGTTHFDIDDLDRVEQVRAPGRGPVQYHYSDAGRVEQIDHPDGTRTDQTFDAAGRIESIGHFRSGEREAFYEYGYDLNGNRISQVEDLGTGEVETTYTYDDADRLIETERAGRVTEYVLDEVGNRVEERITDAGSTTTKVLSYNERNQLENIEIDSVLVTEYDYDANGNRVEATTSGLTRHFTFGARDRLKSLHLQGGPPEVEWEYDDAGFRVSETTTSEARRFRWDGETLAFETNVLGNLLSRYDHGPDRLLAETEGGSTRTWLTDALRTPVKRLSDDGNTYSVTRYDEYGKVEEETSPDTPRFGFTGHQRGPQEEPDLYYAQQRWYNAATGRFLSEDPLWGQTETPLSLHRYLYAYANPTVWIDPDGRAVVMRNGEVERVIGAASQGDGLAVNSKAMRTLVREHGLASEVSTRGPGGDQYLSSDGVTTVASVLADAWRGQDAPHAFLIVESGDTPEAVAAEYKRQMGDFGSVMDSHIAEDLGNRSSPGQVFDISIELMEADREARREAWTYRAADYLRSRREQMGSVGRAASAPSQFVWDATAATHLAGKYTVGTALGGQQAPASVQREANIEIAMMVGPGVVLKGRHAVRATDARASTRFTTTQWQAPSGRGTGQNYTVYQQRIDWSFEVGGLSNQQRALSGNAPYIMKNGQPSQIQLHHSRQDARGSLFEVSAATHQARRNAGGRALHPYGRSQHPDYPVDRNAFGADRNQYWIDRINAAIEGAP